MNLGLFDNRRNNNKNEVTNKFIEELKNSLKNMENEEINHENNDFNNISETSNVLDEYDLYEKKKIYLDNQTRNGNNLVWILDENSVCISKHGDGGTISINNLELPLPNDATIGEVYEEIDGQYIYNEEITEQIKCMTL